MADYGIWLSWNNQQEGFELPILPREFGPSIRGDGAGHDVYKLGKINIIKDRELAEYTIESFFPAQRYPFVTAQYLLEPRAYVDYIMRWWESKRPIRLTAVLPSIEINTPASIEQFEWKEVAGSPGDISFSLRLKEYRFYAARQVQVAQVAGVATVQKSQAKRPDERVQPKTYTLKPGDTLWTVAQRYLGNGSRWREIAKLNGIKDSQVRSLPVGLTLKLPS